MAYAIWPDIWPAAVSLWLFFDIFIQKSPIVEKFLAFFPQIKPRYIVTVYYEAVILFGIKYFGVICRWWHLSRACPLAINPKYIPCIITFVQNEVEMLKLYTITKDGFSKSFLHVENQFIHETFFPSWP